VQRCPPVPPARWARPYRPLRAQRPKWEGGAPVATWCAPLASGADVGDVTGVGTWRHRTAQEQETRTARPSMSTCSTASPGGTCTTTSLRQRRAASSPSSVCRAGRGQRLGGGHRPRRPRADERLVDRRPELPEPRPRGVGHEGHASSELFDASGWQVVEAKYGRRLQALFARDDGPVLRRHIDDMANEDHQALFTCPAARRSCCAGRRAPLGGTSSSTSQT